MVVEGEGLSSLRGNSVLEGRGSVVPFVESSRAKEIA
jgi:hypothetical protein